MGATAAPPHPAARRIVERFYDEVCPLTPAETVWAMDLISAEIRADPLLSAAAEMRELLKRWVRENRETLGQDCDCVHCETCRILDRAAGLCGSGSGDGYGDS